MRSKVVGWLIATTLVGAGCHTMAPISLDQLDGLRPSRVWVTQGDQSVVVVSGPQVFGDTLVGYVNGEFQELPTAGVTQVVMRRAAKGKTIALIAAGTAAGTMLAVLMSGSGLFHDASKFVDCDDDPDRPECMT